MAVTIEQVLPRSLAGRAGVRAGERLLAVNGNAVTDVLDYRFYITEKRVELLLQDESGRERTVALQKGEYDDIGLEFATYLMDKQHTCTNKCIFCFVDQMPPGMRESLYFKDDDARMSFLFGNYITLTNLSDADIDRIIKMRISPVNVSVHTTDPDLRTRLMINPHAGTSLRYLTRLAQAGIKINTQVVLCPGINDGPALSRTLCELGALWPAVQSIACVPVGLTKHRAGLPELHPYDKNTAKAVVETVEAFAQKHYECKGVRLAYPADEFFLLAGLELPKAAYYGDFDQLENGVGLLALLEDEFLDALENEEPRKVDKLVTIATGAAAFPMLSALAKRAEERFLGLKINVKLIKNDTFGHTITVAGLLTGRDVAAQLGGQALGDEVLLSASMLRHERDRFLDDETPESVAAALGVPVTPVDNDGWALLTALLGPKQ